MKVRNQKPNNEIEIAKFIIGQQINLPKLYFTDLWNSLKQHDYFKLTSLQKIQSNQNSILTSHKTIKPKMFTKIIMWMQKLCLQTFQFSLQTFEISVKILKTYLQASEESPKILQMLGCIALHIASKINEQTIISIDSYIQCSMNIFNKQQFIQKQALFYRVLSTKSIHTSFCNIVDFLSFEIRSKQIVKQDRNFKLYQIIKQLIKDLQILDQNPFHVICNLWTEVMTNPQYQFNKQQFIILLGQRKFQY